MSVAMRVELDWAAPLDKPPPPPPHTHTETFQWSYSSRGEGGTGECMYIDTFTHTMLSD